MIRWIICLLAIATTLEGANADQDHDELVIHSIDADYNGKEITLNGDVIVEHELGKIFADQVILERNLQEKKIRFPLIKMNNHVRVEFNEGAQLSCKEANLNYITMTGHFSGDEGQEVIYTDLCHEKNSICMPFIVKSRRMTVNIVRDGQEKNVNSFISHILAEENVTVNYRHNFSALSDKAVYHRLEGDDLSSCHRNLEGVIHLQAHPDKGQCQITNTNGDSIKAQEIQIDTLRRNLVFIYPQGLIHVTRNSDEVEEIAISADTMLWDEALDILTLQEHIVMEQGDIGKMVSDDHVKVYQTTAQGKKQLHKVIADGKTILTYIDKDKDLAHVLTSHGQLAIDHQMFKTIIESPRDAQGKVLQGQQVSFQDYMGSIIADKLTLEYEMRHHTIIPKKFIMEGNVHICNQFSEHSEENGALLQYVLADSVEYWPQSREMILTAKKNPRVLFFDRINNIQVSATALKIKRDAKTKKDAIQGIGDVRFTFQEQELEQLREKFNFASKS